MQRSFLAKLQRSARLSLCGALMLLLLVPIVQLFLLGPRGYGASLGTPQASLAWIHAYTTLFLLYRLTLMLGFVFLLVVPFALFRIIVAQEIVGRAELAEEELEDEVENDDEEMEDEVEKRAVTAEEDEESEDGMPAFAWRGKGFAVLASWTGLLGLLAAVGGVLGSTLYLWSSASIVSARAPVPDNYASVSSLFAVLAYALGGGLLALSCLFFGFMIARSGRKLWPDSWVAFGYAGLGIGALISGSAVQTALAPGNQATLTTPALLLFAVWMLWFSLMVVRLRPE